MNERDLRPVGLLVLSAVVLVAALTPGIAWRFVPLRPLGVLIVDKTVPDTSFRGHRAVVWLLNHLKVVHPASHEPYDAAADYSGFVPLTARAWSVRPLPADFLSRRIIYIADTYGVRQADLVPPSPGGEGRLLYGGLTASEADLLESAARGGATVVAEFNTIGDPTPADVRQRVERLLGFRWTGWTGRRLQDLGEETPPWAVAGWEQQHQARWPFRGPGLLLAHSDGRIVVLGKDVLRGTGLEIVPTRAGKAIGMRRAPAPETWFDIVQAEGSTPLASYRLNLSSQGELALRATGLRVEFPAVLRRDGAAPAYYLAGDFASVPRVPAWTGLRWGGEFYRMRPSWSLDAGEAFFWRGYVPLLTSVVETVLGS
jgi:hypothetical protein